MSLRESYVHGLFSWVDLTSSDAAEAKEFYRGLMGWSAEDQETQGGPYSLFRLEGHAVAGLGEMNEDMKAQGIAPFWNSYINVDDIQATCKKALSLGATLAMPVMKINDAGSMAFLIDPTGAHFALWQANEHIGASKVNAPNSWSWSELLTDDVDTAKQFYGELLGWSFESSPGPVDYTLIVVPGAVGESHGGMLKITKEMQNPPPHWAVFFSVEKLEDSIQKVRDLGGSVHKDVTEIPNVGRFAVITDAQGAALTLFELPKQP